MNIHTIKTQSKELKGLLDEILKEKLQSEVAKLLDVKAPQLSNLYKVISDIESKVEDEQSLELILEKYNNIGRKTIKKLPDFSQKLKNIQPTLKLTKENVSYYQIWKNNIFQLIDNTQEEIIQRGLVGLYECYVHSTTMEKIVKSPFVIRQNNFDGKIEVLHKRMSDYYACRGIMFLVKSHLITICMLDTAELSGSIKEPTFVHLTLPLKPNSEVLKGIWINLTENNQPAASRIVLKKIGKPITEKELTNYHYGKLDYDEVEIKAIREYLQDSIESTIRCMPALNTVPGTMASLEEEKRNIKKRYKDYPEWKK